ncbi:MAG TPA: tRNA (guanosine(46)-N7)-methyltransferase TrmB [Ktedonobacterales bacterium]|nr:tRNA (guanosine(46)-N7)-methyltransferase TrmB [Ktedonobacterales bacterium]
MSRRLLNRHIRPRPLDDQEIARYLRVYDARALYQHPEAFPPLCSPALFGNDAPLELEVGCGTAEFLCSLAASEREVNFVGVDIARRPLYKAIGYAAPLALTNLRLLQADFAQLYPLLAPHSLRRVYVHFPDPHARPKFQRRRVVTPAFLSAIHRTLVPGGSLSVMTDHAALFQEMLAVVEADCRFQKTHDERYLTGFEPALKSRFQRIWERHGLPILRLEVRTRQA